MNRELKDMSTIDLVTEITRLEQEIGLKTLRHNVLVQEIFNRYPELVHNDAFPIIEDVEKVNVGRNDS